MNMIDRFCVKRCAVGHRYHFSNAAAINRTYWRTPMDPTWSFKSAKVFLFQCTLSTWMKDTLENPINSIQSDSAMKTKTKFNRAHICRSDSVHVSFEFSEKLNQKFQSIYFFQPQAPMLDLATP